MLALEIPERAGAGIICKSERVRDMGAEKIKDVPAGIRAIIVWTIAYILVVIAACFYFWNVDARGYGGFVPDSLIDVTYGERAVFYIICFGGWIVNIPIAVKIRGLIEKTAGYSWKSEQKRYLVNGLPFLVVMVIVLAVCWNKAISFPAISGLYALSNLESLWVYRRELNLVREE